MTKVIDITPRIEFNFWSWFAGFVDGEGTISITKKSPQRVNSTYYPQYRAFLSIASTDKNIIDFIKDQLSVGTTYSYSDRKEHHKKAYMYALNKKSDLINVLEKLIPLLKIKYSQAVWAFEFLQSRKNYKYERNIGKSSYTEQELLLHKKMKEINTRGI